uniref:ER membrane protein complex subunit 10 n=1 Tax=Chromera velia CCMP2878 TaxID=1169474 RepID=A0A0G4FXG6_9ALVE|eukprot:Cvel_19227.t1-p1 / transcript=Cvel_19227.t1 / gene=Cvel_19227 / organism=Chromera_velia_CCMP2878 / gene_product=hypothetical protein / transcript_product=hypothetical protein / location=Cvel_scaffold1643:13901-20072(-) / protein_length=314 / sequence_SO=supercontig / SO=protein_coding / is_pseudo=false
MRISLLTLRLRGFSLRLFFALLFLLSLLNETAEAAPIPPEAAQRDESFSIESAFVKDGSETPSWGPAGRIALVYDSETFALRGASFVPPVGVDSGLDAAKGVFHQEGGASGDGLLLYRMRLGGGSSESGEGAGRERELVGSLSMGPISHASPLACRRHLRLSLNTDGLPIALTAKCVSPTEDDGSSVGTKNNFFTAPSISVHRPAKHSGPIIYAREDFGQMGQPAPGGVGQPGGGGGAQGDAAEGEGKGGKGKGPQKPQEKTFMQKYWWAILLGVLFIQTQLKEPEAPAGAGAGAAGGAQRPSGGGGAAASAPR